MLYVQPVPEWWHRADNKTRYNPALWTDDKSAFRLTELTPGVQFVETVRLTEPTDQTVRLTETPPKREEPVSQSWITDAKAREIAENLRWLAEYAEARRDVPTTEEAFWAAVAEEQAKGLSEPKRCISLPQSNPRCTGPIGIRRM
jgi:hypothetical protein